MSTINWSEYMDIVTDPDSLWTKEMRLQNPNVCTMVTEVAMVLYAEDRWHAADLYPTQNQLRELRTSYEPDIVKGIHGPNGITATVKVIHGPNSITIPINGATTYMQWWNENAQLLADFRRMFLKSPRWDWLINGSASRGMMQVRPCRGDRIILNALLLWQ